MPKFYYPSPDELQGATPLNELVWFEEYQYLLVKLANTDWGRDLLLIDKHPYPVVAIGKNYVRFHLGVWDDQDHYLSDFRVGAKWGNIIRYRWLEVKKAIDRIILESILSYPSVYYRGRRLHPVGGGATTTKYPDADVESTTVDGAITNNPSPHPTFSALRNASNGTLAQPSHAAPYMARLSASVTTDKYSIIARGFFLFDTNSIPTGDTVVSATFDLVYTERGDGLSASIAMVDVGSLASNTNLETGDYNKLGTTRQAADLTYAGLTVNSATYNSFTLNSTGLGNISKTGITKFGTRIDLDLDDMSVSEAQALWSSEAQSYLAAAMADNTVLTDKAPRLVVTHNSPFTPKVIIF